MGGLLTLGLLLRDVELQNSIALSFRTVRQSVRLLEILADAFPVPARVAKVCPRFKLLLSRRSKDRAVQGARAAE
jgi:hypothetical protein